MLRYTLWANAASCLSFGILFLAAGGAVAGFLGDPPDWLVQAVGAGLILNGLHLAMTARKPAPSRAETLYFAMGDGFWVAATLALVAAGLWITTPGGVAATILVAIWVGGCGAVQLWRAPPSARRA